MNLRNRWLVHTVRTLVALLLIVMALMGLYYMTSGIVPEVPGTTDATRAAETGLAVSGLTWVAKIVELVAGIMLLLNFRPAFATLILAPVSVGIMVYDLALWTHVPAALIPAVFLFVVNVYLGHVYWPKYKAVFAK